MVRTQFGGSTVVLSNNAPSFHLLRRKENCATKIRSSTLLQRINIVQRRGGENGAEGEVSTFMYYSFASGPLGCIFKATEESYLPRNMHDRYSPYFLMFWEGSPGRSTLPRHILNHVGNFNTGNPDHGEIGTTEESMEVDTWTACLLGLKHHHAEQLWQHRRLTIVLRLAILC